MGASAAQAHGDGTSPAGNLILTNGEIHTMDRRDSVVEVVAIRDGEVVYTGDRESAARKEFADKPRTLDLRGKTAMPGIIDNHNHIVLMGNRPGYHTPLENAYSIADVQSTIRARAPSASRAGGSWITTIGGFHFNHLVPPSRAYASRRWPSSTRRRRTTPSTSRVGFSGSAA